MENGKIIKCMAKDYLLGLTGGDIMESILTIKNKDMEYSIGQMEEGMKGIGKMENNMVKEFL